MNFNTYDNVFIGYDAGTSIPEPEDKIEYYTIVNNEEHYKRILSILLDKGYDQNDITWEEDLNDIVSNGDIPVIYYGETPGELVYGELDDIFGDEIHRDIGIIIVPEHLFKM